MTSTASPLAIPFIAAHEGFVSKAYRDAGGVLTIGYGFTGLSEVFAAYWLASRGHKLRMGDTIDRAEADTILAKLIEAEYAPPVDKRFDDLILDHQFDAATSVTFNCGAGTLKDKWAAALAEGRAGTAADLLRSTRVTAGGKRLTGLVRRRADEARLMEWGDYGKPATAAAETPEEIADYQRQLARLGYSPGPADGVAGDRTVAAVKVFQIDHGLKVDGIVGPATRAALQRAIDARTAAETSAGGAVVGGGAGTAVEVGGDPGSLADIILPLILYGALAVALIVIAYLVWRNRGRIFGWRTPS